MNTLLKYIRDENGQRCGSVVALERPMNDGSKEVVIAFSIFHKGKDTYNQELGTKIAVGRAMKGRTKSKVPSYAVS